MKLSSLTVLTLLARTGFAGAAPQDPYPDQQPQQGQQQPQPPQGQQQQQPLMDQQQQQHKAAPSATADDSKDVKPVDLLFDTDSATLDTSAAKDLKIVATWAKCNAKGAVILEGHADPRGTQAYNMALSGQRAAAVRAKLIAMGVPSDRIVVTVYGENGPNRPTFAEQRRVTVRATERPIQPSDITAQK